jgi:methyltransferase-like protein
MADSLPGATFVGVDLAEKEILAAQETAQRCGLTNLSFVAADILTLGAELGTFDYIIAHGVYAWVPPAVQERILWLCGKLLTEKGVAYISYNALPGGHVRQIQRDLMLYHTRNDTDPAVKIRKAREISAAVVDSVRQGETVFRGILTTERDRISELNFHLLYHDDLSAFNEPLYLHEFVARANRHGLRYLADSDFSSMHPHRCPPAAHAFLAQTKDRVEFEQYLDFLCCRTFRRTLLCRAQVELAPAPIEQRPQRLWVISSATPQTWPVDLVGKQVARFRNASGLVVGLTDEWSKAMLLCLSEAAPRPLPFDELLRLVSERLQTAGAQIELDPQQLAVALSELLLSLYSGNMVELHAQVPAVASSVAERPLASPLARQQLGKSTMLVNLWHRNVLIDNELALRLLPLLDGTRTQSELSAALTVSQDELSDALNRLVRLGFLCASAG